MDLNKLFKDVTSFNKEAAMKENMRMVELKDSVTAQAFRDAQRKLASYVNIIKIDSPESNLTEFSRNKLSGKMKAMLSVSTTAGLKRLPIHFVVKASVASMVETPEQVVAALDNVEGSIDKEVKEILEKQKQMSAYHNDDIEVKAEDEKYLSDEQIAEQYQNPKIVSYQIFKRTNLEYPYYDVCLELEFPDATHPDYNDFVVEWVTYTPNTNDFKYDHWYPDNVYKFIEDYIVKTIEENKEQLDSTGKAEALLDSSSFNSNIKVQAKKKEIDLGVRENTSASQFPVKLLVYPKTYLPELKKGDILNVGGFKYRYIGDEPTISGDTENGINARFELVVNTKKASLNVTAVENKEKQNAEVGEELKKNEENQDFSDLTPNELMGLLISYAEYNVNVPTEALKEVAKNPQLSAWFMMNFSKTIEETLDGDATPKIIDSAFSSPKCVADIIEHFAKENTTIDKLPQKYQDAILSDGSALASLVKKCPQLLTEDVADKLISSNPIGAGEIATTETTETFETSKGFKKLKEWAKEQGLFNDVNEVPTSEELGIEDVDNYETPSSNDQNDLSDVMDVEKEHTQQQKSQSGEDFSGTGLEDTIKKEVTAPEDESNQTQDILDDNDKLMEDDEVKKKTSSEQPIDKEAETTEDLTFSADLSSLGDQKTPGVSFDEGDDGLLAALKEQHPQFKNIPNEWIEVWDTEWSGKLVWAIDIDAREWGLSNFSIVCKPMTATCRLSLRYFENAEAADLQDETEDTFDVTFELGTVDAQIDTALSENSQLFAQRIEISSNGTALVFF